MPAPVDTARSSRPDLQTRREPGGRLIRDTLLPSGLRLRGGHFIPVDHGIWTIYDEPRDAVRLILGFVVSVWIVYHLFRLPREAQGYRIWASLGIALVPLTLAMLFVIW